MRNAAPRYLLALLAALGLSALASTPAIAAALIGFEDSTVVPPANTASNPRSNFFGDYNFSGHPDVDFLQRTPGYIGDAVGSPWYQLNEGKAFGLVQAITNTPLDWQNDGLGVNLSAAEIAAEGFTPGGTVYFSVDYAPGTNYYTGAVRDADADTTLALWAGNGAIANFQDLNPTPDILQAVGAFSRANMVGGYPVMPADSWKTVVGSLVWTGGDVHFAFHALSGPSAGVETIFVDNVLVGIPVIFANPESLADIGTLGGTTSSVLGSDRFKGAPTNLTEVNITVGASDPALTLDPATGLITVAPGTAPGTYSVTYTICDATDPTICDAATETVNVVQSLDYSDAPTTGTSYGETSHTSTNAIKLGAAVTGEFSGYDSPNADGDADDGLTMPAFEQGNGAQIPVTVNGAGGYLQAWIDWDGDGNFSGTYDQIALNAQDGGYGDVDGAADGVITLTVAAPKDATTSQTFARFRWSTTQDLDSTTAATDGEVEDYALTITARDWQAEAIGLCPAGTTPVPVSLIQNPDFENYTGCPNYSTGSTINNADFWADSHPTGGQLMLNDAPSCFSPRPATSWPQHTDMYRGISGKGWLGGHSGNDNVSGEGATNTLSAPILPGNTYVGHFGIARTDYTGPFQSEGAIAFYGASNATIGSFNGAGWTPDNYELLHTTAPTTSAMTWDRRLFSLAPTNAWDYFRVEVRRAGGANPWVYFDDFQLYECQSLRDYSDAPTTGTTYGEANHAIDPSMQLGAAVSNETAGYDDANAAGDADDGVVLPAMAQGATVTIPVTVSGTGGYLQAWIDWDGDGNFTGTNDQIATDIQDGGAGDADGAADGTIMLSVSVPANATTNQTFARFRWSTTQGLDSTTTASDGEVEDYALAINSAVTGIPVPITSCGNLLVGEGAGSFGTLASGVRDLEEPPSSYSYTGNLGAAARYVVVSQVDSESIHPSNGFHWSNLMGHTTGAPDDAYLAVNGDVAEGVFYQQEIALPASGSYQIALWGINAVRGSGVPDADIGIRMIRVSDGAQIAQVSTGPMSRNPPFTGPENWTQAVTNFSATQGGLHRVEVYNLSSTSSGNDFAIDDISVAPLNEASCPNFDYSDTPTTGTNYGTAVHGVVASIQLGAGVTDETAGYDSPNANGDADDGLTMPAFEQGNSAQIPVTVNGAGGYLQAWIDWDGDGNFDSDEQIATDLQDGGLRDFDGAADGTITLQRHVPIDATTSQTFARFRWSTTQGLDSTTAASDGEVEDYALTIAPLQIPNTTAATACVAPNFTGAALNTTGMSFPVASGPAQTASFSTDASGNTVTTATFTGITVTGSSGNEIVSGGSRFVRSEEGGPHQMGTQILHSIEFAQQVPIELRSGTYGTGTNSNMHQDQDQLVFVASGVSSGFSWSVDNLDDGSFELHAGGQILVITTGSVASPTPAAFTDFLVSTNGELTRLDVYHNTLDLVDAASHALNSAQYELHVPECASFDYSDAPTSGTSYGEANHAIDAAIQLGATVTDETAGYDSPNADGDADDGVTLPTFTQGATVRIPVSVNGTGGYLQAWIDWDGDGSFAEAGDRVATNIQDGGGANDYDGATDGTITLSVNVPTNATTSQTFARFRWSTTVSLDSTAAASDGEVEDYALTIQNPAPLTCGVPENTGVGGSIIPFDMTGMSVSAASPTQSKTTTLPDGRTFTVTTEYVAGGSWNNFTMTNARAVVKYLPQMNGIRGMRTTSRSAGSNVMRVTVSPAAHIIWGDSESLSTAERVTVTTNGGVWEQVDGTTPEDFLMVNGLETTTMSQQGVNGTVYNDFVMAVSRNASQLDIEATNITSGGLSGFFIAFVGTDNGDADASYGLAPHQIDQFTACTAYGSSPYLGSAAPDAEDPSNTQSADANGDNALNSGSANDEDGVRRNGTTLQDQTLSNDSPSTFTVTTTGSGRLHGWIDWDGDGTFGNNANELIVSEAANASGTRTINITPPNNLTPGASFARFRYATDAAAANPTGIANDGEVEDYRIFLDRGFAVSGRVFNDTNVNATNDAGEPGIGGVAMVLYDANSATCRSTRTDANGDYQFTNIAAGDYRVYEAADESVPTPQSCDPANTADPAGYLSTVNNASAGFTISNSDLGGINFGDIEPPTFELDNTQTILPNSAVLHPHVFTAPTDGSVSFNVVSENFDPANLNWGRQLLLDANCDGQLSSANGDSAMPASINVTAGQQVCILAKVIAPANATTAAVHVIDIRSDFTYGDGSLLNNDQQNRQDITRTLAGTTTAPPVDPTVDPVGSPDPIAGEGKLSLVKSVWNVSRNIDGNVALPGETLRYIIHYENVGNGPLNELMIQDSVPAFTTLIPASMLCTDTPTELPSCAANDSADGSLSWEWTVNDKLNSGSKGSVSYEVVIE